jgi:hypothetical protein
LRSAATSSGVHIEEFHSVTIPVLRASAVLAVIATVLLAACGGTSVSPSASATTSPSIGASASVEPSVGPTGTAEPSDEPTDDLGDFGCDFPVTAVGSVDRAQVTDIRVGQHDGYDRVVFEFDAGIPQFTLDEATPPLLADGSGLPIEVDGNAFWQLVMQGGTMVSPDGEMTYDGETTFTPRFPLLQQLINGGDFEAVGTWYFGLESAACVRVITLSSPSRLVIDIEH